MTLLLVIALTAVIAAAGIAVRRERRRNAALEQELAARVPRTELQSTLASLEALLEAAPTPVIQFDRGGNVRRSNGAALAAFPDEAMPASLRPLVEEVLGGADVVDREITVEEPVRRRWEVHLRVQADGALAVLVDVTASGDFREARR